MRTIRFCSLSVTMPSTIALWSIEPVLWQWLIGSLDSAAVSLVALDLYEGWDLIIRVDQLRLVSEPAGSPQAYSLILRWWSWAPAAMHLYIVLATASIYISMPCYIYSRLQIYIRSNKSSLSLTELAFECRRLMLIRGCWFGRLSSSHGWLDGISPYPSYGLWSQYLFSTKQSDLIALILFFAGTMDFYIINIVGQSGVCLSLKQDLNNDCGLAEWYASLQYLHQKINITAGATSLNVDQSAVFCTTFPCFPRSQPTDDDPPRGHS